MPNPPNSATNAFTTSPFLLSRPEGEPLVLQLSPLGLGFQRQLKRDGLEMPRPPMRVQRDSTGQPLRDQQGQVIVAADTTDDDYRNELELYHQRIAVLAAAEALRHDPQFAFGTLKEASPNITSFADAVFDHFAGCGWRAGDLVKLADAIAYLSNLTEGHLDHREQQFFCHPQAPRAKPV